MGLFFINKEKGEVRERDKSKKNGKIENYQRQKNQIHEYNFDTYFSQVREDLSVARQDQGRKTQNQSEKEHIESRIRRDTICKKTTVNLIIINI